MRSEPQFVDYAIIGDPREPRVRVRGSQEARVGHSRQREIAHVPSASGGLLDAVHPRDGLPDDAERSAGAHAGDVSRGAVATMASTILTYPVQRHRLPRR